MTASIYIPESALAIVAHPDDAEFLCTGTMARWAEKAGARCVYVLCTSGDVGIDDPGMTRRRRSKFVRRKPEMLQRDCRHPGSCLPGGTEWNSCRQPLNFARSLCGRSAAGQRLFSAGAPQTFFVSENYINHPDHRAAGVAGLDAVFPAAGQPNLFEELEAEGLKPIKPERFM